MIAGFFLILISVFVKAKEPDFKIMRFDEDWSKARYIGSQLAFSGEWQISRHFFFLAEYMHFFTGSFIEDVTPGKDVDFYTMWVTYKF